MDKENEDRNESQSEKSFKKKNYSIKSKGGQGPLVLTQKITDFELNLRVKDLEKSFWEMKTKYDRKLTDLMEQLPRKMIQQIHKVDETYQ